MFYNDRKFNQDIIKIRLLHVTKELFDLFHRHIASVENWIMLGLCFALGFLPEIIYDLF